MKIEALIRREGGSTVDFPGKSYLFAPGEDDRHVCDVDDAAHAERLLSITEGYREVCDQHSGCVDVDVVVVDLPPRKKTRKLHKTEVEV